MAPELPAGDFEGELRSYCYQSMFEGCTSPTASPVLWADELVTNCYINMFNGCEKLKSITCFTTSGMGDNTSNWVTGVPSGGTFNRSASLDDGDWPTGNNGIPSGWNVESH